MQLEFHYHRHANLLVQHDQEFKADYDELIKVLHGISDKDLQAAFKKDKANRPSAKSLSVAINSIIKSRLKAKNWKDEVGLFKEPPYTKKNTKKWRLDFAKNHISVEVAFNHSGSVAHNILKPVLASELNHVEKENQTKLGIVIVATEEMKKAGNFDSAIGTYDMFKEYFRPYNTIISTPIILIGIKAPTSFYIDEKSKNIKII